MAKFLSYVRSVTHVFLFVVLASGVTSCSGSNGDRNAPMQVTVSGLFVDSRGNPVPLAMVTITPTDSTAVVVTVETDLDGRFEFVVDDGTYNLTIESGGEVIVQSTITAGGSLQVDLGTLTATTDFFPWYEDADGDSYGSTNLIVVSPAQPAGFTDNFGDCNDNDLAVNPGAAEACNEVDDNCNGDVDEGVRASFYADTDSDGFGNPADSTLACDAPAGFVADGSDCDDTLATVNPGATEVCNGIDDSCDGNIDEGVTLTYFLDSDGDLFGTAQQQTEACSLPDGYADNELDCDDADASINPDAPEACNGVDDNCNAAVDEGLLLTFFQDFDSDGFGNAQTTQQACATPTGFVSDNTDCDDTAASVHPGAPEICNEVDDNCDAQIDEGLTSLFFADQDADTYGNPDAPQEACTLPNGFSVDNTDCDDTDARINPDTVWYGDSDGDTFPLENTAVVQCEVPAGGGVPDYLVAAFDCDDANASVNPGLLEIVGNGVDDDCNAGTGDEAAIYGQESLAGEWKYFAINAGDAANDEWNGWMEGYIVFDDQGLITDYRMEYDDGSVDLKPLVSLVLVSPGGILTSLDDPTLHGAMSQDQDTAVATYTDIEGGATMMILQKTQPNPGFADFSGDWDVNALVTGDDPEWTGWIRGTASIDPTGIERFQLNRSDNDIEDGYIGNDIDSDGFLETPWHRRSVSADQQLTIGRLNYEYGYGLEVLSRGGGVFAPGNLQGDWSFHVLAAGDAPEVNAWRNGMIVFDSAGNGTTQLQFSSDPTLEFALDGLSVDSTGIIVSAMEPSFHAVLTRNKDTIVGTYTDQTGAANLLFALRRDPPPLELVGEEFGSTTAAISPSVGGSIEAMSGDGTSFRLDIPPDAIASDRDVRVKLTPLASVGTVPLVTDYLGAVSLAPEGLQFETPATLTVTLPFPAPISNLVSYYFQGSGNSFRFVPIFPPQGATSVDTFSIDIDHFSTGGGGTGLLPDNIDSSLIPRHDRNYYESRAAAIMQQEGVRFLDPANADDNRVKDRLTANLEEWLNVWIYGVVDIAAAVGDNLLLVYNAAHELLELREFVQTTGRQYHIWGVSSTLPPYYWTSDIQYPFPGVFDDVVDDLNTIINTNLEYLEGQCYSCTGGVGENPPECDYIGECDDHRRALSAAKLWIDLSAEMNQLLGLPGSSTSYESFCNGIAQELSGAARLKPVGVYLSPNEATTFKLVMLNMMPTPDFLQPFVEITDPMVASASFSDNGAGSDVNVLGISAGEVILKVSDPLHCPAVSAFVNVEASGLWDINVIGRQEDNCHYAEEENYVPYPPVLQPNYVDLTIDPYTRDAMPFFELYWYDSTSFMIMTGDSGNSHSSHNVRIGGEVSEQTDTGIATYEQTCDLDLTGAKFHGSCDFRKYEVSGVTQNDICQGQYYISGHKL